MPEVEPSRKLSKLIFPWPSSGLPVIERSPSLKIKNNKHLSVQSNTVPKEIFHCQFCFYIFVVYSKPVFHNEYQIPINGGFLFNIGKTGG